VKGGHVEHLNEHDVQRNVQCNVQCNVLRCRLQQWSRLIVFERVWLLNLTVMFHFLCATRYILAIPVYCGNFPWNMRFSLVCLICCCWILLSVPVQVITCT